MAGILYGWIGVYYGQMAQMVDTWVYHFESLKETELLKSNPVEFITSLFQKHNNESYTNFFSSQDSWWNDVKANFFIKILAVFNLLSHSNYYINVIFYSFITLFGPVALFRIMQNIYPGRKLPVLLATFLIPSFLYWTSGLHKEGLIFLGLSLIMYSLYFGFKEKKFTVYSFILIFLGFILILLLRNYVIIALVTPLMAWVISAKTRFKPIFTFGFTLLLSLAFFFSSKYLAPSLNLPGAIVNKQQEFLQLEGGGSTVQVKELEPTLASFIKNVPQAVSLSILRPYPSDVHHLLSLAAAIEINMLLLLIIIFFIWRKDNIALTPFNLFCLFFSAIVLLMIGYTVNILGAIVRYRSIVLPLLFIPIIAHIDWTKPISLITGNINVKNNN